MLQTCFATTILCALILMPGSAGGRAFALAGGQASGQGKKHPKEPEQPEPFKIDKLTQGIDLQSLGPVSPDGHSLLLIGKKPDSAPNLYIMNLDNFSLRPPITRMRSGVADPNWSPKGDKVAFAGFDESSFSEIYVLDLSTNELHRMTNNNFTDKQPVFTPDGLRLIYTTDESPLPDAAFGTLHIDSIPLSGGKGDYFAEDDVSKIEPRVAAGGKTVYVVQIDEQSGRHSLWQYNLDGKEIRNLTDRKFARIQSYVINPHDGTIIIEGQEQPEQQEDIYVVSASGGDIQSLPNPDLPKRSPAVSPNGKLTAFIGSGARGNQLFVYDSTTGNIQQLTNKALNTFSPVFISDTKILFGSNRLPDQQNEVYLVDLSVPSAQKEEKKEKK
ncbi:MAG TPA: hypothetical protein VJX67_00900 [Blastocatellia bacterium]|nr:hypothetical protein [Blastocatellia bacterium]